jgi:hypothetical protein
MQKSHRIPRRILTIIQDFVIYLYPNISKISDVAIIFTPLVYVMVSKIDRRFSQKIDDIGFIVIAVKVY